MDVLVVAIGVMNVIISTLFQLGYRAGLFQIAMERSMTSAITPIRP